MSRKQNDPCVVCFNKIDYVSVGECGHKVCCATCTFRLRQLHCDEKCVVCKTKLALVFITVPTDRRSFAELVQSATTVQDEATAIRFVSPEALPFKLEIDTMRMMQCCADTFTSKQALEKHMEVKHRTKLCQLCVEQRGLFFQEHQRFTAAQLQQHIKQEHPTCKFCRNKAFYNNDAIYKHLNEKHEQCHVCAKLASASTSAVQQQVDYFKDYTSLEQHFRTKHFLCEEPSCLRVHFVNVFATEVEWRNHERQVHGKQSKQPLRFEFGYKDSSPASALQEEEEERAPQQQHVPLQASDFPPLLGARTSAVVSTGAAFRLSKNATASRSNNRTDDFPELRKASTRTSSNSSSSAVASFRRPVTAPPIVQQSHADFPSLSSVAASLPRASAATPPPQQQLVSNEEDFPALQRPSSRNSNNGRLTRDQVRDLAFAPKAPKASTATTGVVLMGKKKQAEEDTKKLTADQKRKQKERKELLSLAFAK